MSILPVLEFVKYLEHGSALSGDAGCAGFVIMRDGLVCAPGSAAASPRAWGSHWPRRSCRRLRPRTSRRSFWCVASLQD